MDLIAGSAELVFAMIMSFVIGAFFFYQIGRVCASKALVEEMRKQINAYVSELQKELVRCRAIIKESGDGWKL